MQKELVLGIDYGGKYTGLAVVDSRSNQVLYARTVKMRDDITSILEGRREQRGIRRTSQTKKKRLGELKAYLISIGFDKTTSVFRTVYSLAHKRGYDYADMLEEKTPEEIEAMDAKERKQWEKEKKEWEDVQRSSRHREEVLRDIREAMANAGAKEEQIKRVENIFNKQYRPKRFNNRILTKCKVEGCGANTPLRKNVRDLLVENIVRFFPVEQTEKDELKKAVLDKNRREEVKKFFRRHRINEFVRKQIYDITDNKLSGRTVFCKKHLLEHEQHTIEERKVFRLAPSLKVKIGNVLTVIKEEILPDFNIDRVVMESNNFDISAKTKGKKRLATDEYGKGHREGGESRKEALLKETNGKCIYCGRSIDVSNAHEDHVFPRKAGGISIFANLVACCNVCNGNKRGRTPLESSILPKPEIVLLIQNDLKRKILEDAMNMNELNLNSIKYMSHASQGWRNMRDGLRELTNNDNLPIEKQSGIITAYFRRWWGFRKERANDAHHALDAVILASQKVYTENGVDMTLKPRYKDGSEFDPEKHLPEAKVFKRDKGNKGSALHDRNPLSIKNNMITRKWMVTEIERGKEDTVISDEYRKRLGDAFERFGIKIGKCLNDEQAKEAGFWLEKNDGRKREKVMSFRCKEKGLGWGQIIKINNNSFKTNVHNVGVDVYLDEKGKRKAYERKNPRLSKYFIEPQQQINGKILFTLRRGDRVKVEGEETIYRIKKLATSPTIEKLIASDGKTKTVSATKLTIIKSHQPGI